MAKPAEHAIQVENLTKRYGDLLAGSTTYRSKSRKAKCLLSCPNRAGKTTTVEIIDMIRVPTSGKVRLLGMDVTKRRAIVPRIGVLLQDFSSFDRITVTETMQNYS